MDEARDGFEKRRAAILERAFSGELTKKWREDNGNIEFTEIDKKDVVGFFKIPKTWKWIESKDIFSKILLEMDTLLSQLRHLLHIRH